MERVADYIGKNICTIRKMVKNSLLPLSVSQDYDIYLFYESIDYEPSQMKRYNIVAKRFKCSVVSVRKAVSRMKKPVT